MPAAENFWLKGLVGQPMAEADGTEVSARFGRFSDLIVTQLHDPFYESTARGNRFNMQLAATTTGIAAGNITGAAAAASTNFALWNPVGSNKNIAISKVFIGIVSGTVVGGPLIHNFATAPSIASVLTNGAITNGLLGLGQSSVARGVAVAAGTTLTGGGALTAFRISPFFFSAGSYADLGGQAFEEDVSGDIVIPPGYMWVPCFAAAGTTVLSAYGVAWEEVPI